MKVVIGLLLVVAGLQSQALTIDEFLKQVAVKNKKFASYDISVEASNDRMTAGDLGLSPTLYAAYSKASDKSLPSSVADRRDLTTATVGLNKKFSTGTFLGIEADTYKNDFDKPVTPGLDTYSTGRLGLSLQQSLWKDSFGAATRLRHTREMTTNKIEKLSFELQKRAALLQAESDYWDYLVAQEDVKLKQSNLDRAKKLETWTKNRVYNGISDQADLLQIQALVGTRELQLATSLDDSSTSAMNIREDLDLKDGEAIPEFTSSLVENRPYVEQNMKNTNMIKIEDYLTFLDAELKKAVADEVTDSLRPDLSLIGKYSTSSYDLDYQTMQNNITKTDRPVTFVGVSFSWMFGSDAVSAQSSSAKKDALASQYRAEQAKITGENAWQDYLRKYQLNKQNVITLEKVAKLQSDRSKEQQIKFSKGRTITSDVVNAETDSAEAQVAFLKAKSGLRKLEATTLLFTNMTE
ncbi:MAG: TolC family protein [Pseudobdellovibrio sp.]